MWFYLMNKDRGVNGFLWSNFYYYLNKYAVWNSQSKQINHLGSSAESNEYLRTPLNFHLMQINQIDGSKSIG